MSGAMVNQYLKELQAEGLIEFKPVNGKSYQYELTQAGQKLRLQLFSAYSSETIQIYTALKNAILARLAPLHRKGLTKIALFGAAETCEVFLSAIQGQPFEVTTLLDNDPAKQGRVFHGHVIAPPEVLENLKCQAVVVTTFGRQDEIFAQIAPLCREKNLEIIRL